VKEKCPLESSNRHKADETVLHFSSSIEQAMNVNCLK
jgi:hypothetical protein